MRYEHEGRALVLVRWPIPPEMLDALDRGDRLAMHAIADWLEERGVESGWRAAADSGKWPSPDWYGPGYSRVSHPESQLEAYVYWPTPTYLFQSFIGPPGPSGGWYGGSDLAKSHMMAILAAAYEDAPAYWAKFNEEVTMGAEA